MIFRDRKEEAEVEEDDIYTQSGLLDGAVAPSGRIHYYLRTDHPGLDRHPRIILQNTGLPEERVVGVVAVCFKDFSFPTRKQTARNFVEFQSCPSLKCQFSS